MQTQEKKTTAKTNAGISSPFSKNMLITLALVCNLLFSTAMTINSELCEKIATFTKRTSEDIQDYFRTLFAENTIKQIAVITKSTVKEVERFRDQLIASGIISNDKSVPVNKLSPAEMQAIGFDVNRYFRSTKQIADLNAETPKARSTVATIADKVNVEKWEVEKYSLALDTYNSPTSFTDTLVSAGLN